MQNKYDIAMGLLSSYLEEDDNSQNKSQIKNYQGQKEQIKKKKEQLQSQLEDLNKQLAVLNQKIAALGGDVE